MEDKQSQTTTKTHKTKYPPPKKTTKYLLEVPSLPAQVSHTNIYDPVKAFLSLARAEAK